MADIKFEIEKKLGILSTNKNNWTKEVNLVSWNGRKAKIDIREWDPEHKIMSKGISLSDEELEKLKKILENF